MQYLVNGVISGLAVALMAMAWQIVYLPTRVLFVALAAIYAFAPFVATSMLDLGWSLTSAASASVLAAAALGALCELLNHGPLSRRGASETAQFVTSLGLYMVLVQAITLRWGGQTHTLRSGIEPAFHFGAVELLQSQMATAAIAILAIAVTVGFLLATPAGLRFRALSENPTALALLGYDIGLYRLTCFSASAALAAVVSLMSAYSVGFDPYLGLNSTLVALAAVLIGGRGSFVGPLIAGLGLGVTRAVTEWVLSPQWQDPITFGLLTLVLFVRPHGFVHRATRLEWKASPR